jgi:hypothetical protein
MKGRCEQFIKNIPKRHCEELATKQSPHAEEISFEIASLRSQ